MLLKLIKNKLILEMLICKIQITLPIIFRHIMFACSYMVTYVSHDRFMQLRHLVRIDGCQSVEKIYRACMIGG